MLLHLSLVFTSLAPRGRSRAFSGCSFILQGPRERQMFVIDEVALGSAVAVDAERAVERQLVDLLRVRVDSWSNVCKQKRHQLPGVYIAK